VPAFRVKLGANDLNYVGVPLNRTHSHSQAQNSAVGMSHSMDLTIYVKSLQY